MNNLKTGDFFRLRNYSTVGGWRVWRIIATKLGALGRESTYELRAVDREDPAFSSVPCVILDHIIFLENLSAPPTDGTPQNSAPIIHRQ